MKLPHRFAVLLVMLVLSLFACRDHDDDERGLTAADNDIRVGEKVIRCALPEAAQEVVDNVQEIVNAARLARSTGRETASVVIPVYFHVIASGPSADEGNLSDDALAAQLHVLNEAYSGRTGGAATPFVFELRGVTRNIDPASVAMDFGSQTDAAVKSALRQGGAETLNVYLAAPPNGTLGYATFPWSYMDAPTLDGVVISYRTVPGGSLPPYNEGDTLTHEVGHWLGLFHTFQGSCSATNDTIGDTAAESGPAFGCQTGRDSCLGGGSDPVQNFMDYSDDSCLVAFSGEQATRVDLLAQRFRGL